MSIPFLNPRLRKEVTELEKYKEELPRKAIGLEWSKD